MTTTLGAAEDEAVAKAEQVAPKPSSAADSVQAPRWRWAVDIGPWWALSMLASAILLVLLVSMWQAKNTEDLIDNSQLVDRATVDETLAAVGEAGGARDSEGPPIEIPTGVFVQSLRFESPSDVHITGYVWQRFPGNVERELRAGSAIELIDDDGGVHDVVPGVILPDQVDSQFETEIRSILTGQKNRGTLRADGRTRSSEVPNPTVPEVSIPTVPEGVPGGDLEGGRVGQLGRATTTTAPTTASTPAPTTTPTTIVAPTTTKVMPEASFGPLVEPASDVGGLPQQDAANPRGADAGSTTVLYYFEGPIRLNLNYREYPFDHKIVALRIWPADFSANVVLIPDFDGYPCKRPGAVQESLHCTSLKSTFGIDEDVVLGEFTRKNTYFSYHVEDYYNSNLGSDKFSQTDYPELQFNILIRRNVLDGFVSNMLPLLVASGLAFGILMTLTGDRKRFDFSTTQVMTTLAGLFLAVLLAHQQLRSEFVGVVYFEYFYFLMYLVLLVIGVLAILINVPSASSRTFFTFGDNLLPQILYWPTVLGTSVVITWLVLFW